MNCGSIDSEFACIIIPSIGATTEQNQCVRRYKYVSNRSGAERRSDQRPEILDTFILSFLRRGRPTVLDRLIATANGPIVMLSDRERKPHVIGSDRCSLRIAKVAL